MDKSPHTHNEKKTGKSIKEKRAEKRAKIDLRTTAEAVSDKVSAGRRK